MVYDKDGNIVGRVFHGSPNPNIKEFKPIESTQTGAFVYAAESPELAAAFGWRMSSMKRTFSYDGDTFQMTERQLNYLKEHDHPVYLYELPADSFERFEKDNWEGREVRSAEPVKPLSVIEIPSAYEYFKNLHEQGKMELYEYPSRPEQIPDNDSDMVKTAASICAMDPKKNGKAIFNELMQDYPQYRKVAEEVGKNIGKCGKDEESRWDYVNNEIYDEENKCLYPELDALVKDKDGVMTKSGCNDNGRDDGRDQGRVMQLNMQSNNNDN